MCAVTGQRKARPHEGAREMEFQRIGPARPRHMRGPQMRTEAAVQFGIEIVFIHRDQRRRDARILRPYQGRPPPRQRQNGKGAGGQKMFIGHAAMRLFMFNGRNDASLRIRPADNTDALRIAHRRGAAIGRHGKPRAN